MKNELNFDRKTIDDMGLRECDQDEAQKEFASYTDEQKRKSYIGGTLAGLYDSINRGDYFESIERVGILNMLDYEDVDYFRAFVKERMGDFEGAVEEYKKVTPASFYYKGAVDGVIRSYTLTGNYAGLNRALTDLAADKSPIRKLELRLQCLQFMIRKYGVISEDIELDAIEAVEKIGDAEESWHSFYSVCRIFADLLAVSGECINQCCNYYEKTQNEISEDNQDVALYVRYYNSFTKILALSQVVQPIRFGNEAVNSLADVALVDKSWETKIEIFHKTDYIQQLMQVLANLESPELHMHEKKYDVIKDLMDQIIRISPRVILQIINEYFDVVSEAVTLGDISALQYMCFSYAEIVVSEEDPFDLKERLGKYVLSNENVDVAKMTEERRRASSMSPKGRDALFIAESMFNKADGNKYGAKDASALALMYFRILEIEYNEKFIKRFKKVIDINVLNKLCGGNKKDDDLSENEKKNRKNWGKDVNLLNELVDGTRKSLEIGTIRILLVKINRSKGNVTNELYQSMLKVLTSKGQQALYSEQMIDLIGKANVDTYRNPGAHTGYVPYSKACEAREIVLKNVELIHEWFKEAP